MKTTPLLIHETGLQRFLQAVIDTLHSSIHQTLLFFDGDSDHSGARILLG